MFSDLILGVCMNFLTILTFSLKMVFRTGLILNCIGKNQVTDFFRQLFVVISLYLSIQDPAGSLKSNVLSTILKSTNFILLPFNFSSNFVPHLIMLIKGKT